MTKKVTERDNYTPEEMDELTAWIENLTVRQAFFLKETYEQYLIKQSMEATRSEYLQ